MKSKVKIALTYLSLQYKLYKVQAVYLFNPLLWSPVLSQFIEFFILICLNLL